MVDIGKFNRLRIAKERSVGYFFDGGEDGDILMPKRHQPEYCEVDDVMDVFVFLDAEDRLTATTMIPYAQVGEVAWLEVIDIHRVGAFLNWGVTKDLLVPLREQKDDMEVGQYYLVYILLDADNRIIGSPHLEEFIKPSQEGDYLPGEEVSLMVAHPTELGYKVIVDHRHWGMLYKSDTFQNLSQGQKLTGYVTKLRLDGKLDVSLQKPGYHPEQIDDLGQTILNRIKAEEGFLPLHDKSAPEDIRAAFGISKKSFKQAVGKLYKERRIIIEPDGLRLNTEG